MAQQLSEDREAIKSHAAFRKLLPKLLEMQPPEDGRLAVRPGLSSVTTLTGLRRVTRRASAAGRTNTSSVRGRQ